jgi:hypothetical protein
LHSDEFASHVLLADHYVQKKKTLAQVDQLRVMMEGVSAVDE